MFCPPTFDSWSCWNATAAGQTAYAPCPFFITGFDPNSKSRCPLFKGTCRLMLTLKSETTVINSMARHQLERIKQPLQTFFFLLWPSIFFFPGDPAVSNQFTHWMWHPCREINSNTYAKVSKFSYQSRPTINHVKDLSRLSFDIPKSNWIRKCAQLACFQLFSECRCQPELYYKRVLT